MRQRVVCVVPDGASQFELATPSGVWGAGRTRRSGADISFASAGLSSEVTLDSGLQLSGLAPVERAVNGADIVVVPTWPIDTRPVPAELVDLLTQAHEAGARLVGLCLGAFAVAATGLLDGRSGTTHWRHRELFAVSHPAVRYEPNTLYVDHGDVITSAGSAAALDCCLHVFRSDHGSEAAARVARSLVTAPHRTGAQSQFASAPPIDATADSLSTALADAAEHIGEVGGVADLVALAQTSRRTLERVLRARLGITPSTWIDEQRVVMACRLLETTDLSIESVADRCGYGSAPTLRRAMRRRRTMTPTAYRSTFHHRATPDASSRSPTDIV